MKRIATVGSLVSMFLFVMMISSSKGAEVPQYDASGTWFYQSSIGWSDCWLSQTPVPPGKFIITQSGNAFTLESVQDDPSYPASIYTNGKINGTIYQIFSRSHLYSSDRLITIVFDLDSSSVGSGYLNWHYLDTEQIKCSQSWILKIQKQRFGIHGACAPSDTVMCLQKGRFSVTVTWENEHGTTGVGHAIPSTDDSGLFWFFSPNNMELLIKILNGCGFNNKYWVFFAATTDQEFTVTVTDTKTGEFKEYTNPLKSPADAVTDTSAFDTCP